MPCTIELTVKADSDCVNARTVSNLWIAIELRGQVPNLDAKMRNTPLNAVIIIDNSLSVSEDSLDTACQSVIWLSRLLDYEDDKLAIITTSSTSPDCRRRSYNELRFLNSHRVEDTQSQLRYAFEDRQQESAWKKALFKVACFLKEVRYSSGHSYQHNHVFILSPGLGGYNELESVASSATIHHVNTSAIPIISKPSTIRGWCLSLSGLSSATSLRDIVLAARQGIIPTTVTNAHVDLHSGRGCRVVKTYGEHYLGNIGQGQTAILLVLLEIPEYTVYPQQNAQTMAQSNLDHDFEELETMLGDVYQDCLEVVATYTDSLGHATTARHVCSIRRPDPSSFWSMARLPILPQPPSADAEMVAGRLVMCISTSAEPMEAPALLDSVLAGFPTCSTALVSQIQAVRRELIFRAGSFRSFQDLSNIAETEEVMTPRQSSENSRPNTVTSSIGSRRDSSDSTATVIHNQQTSTDSTDSARRIWQHMRKDSKSNKHQGITVCNNSQIVASRQDQLMTLRREALRNKRSIGADSLRSFSLPGVDGRSSVAPWL